MADTYDISTLLPTKTLQRIMQHFGSPSFTPNSYNTSANNPVYIHLMTGRVPTLSEFYYGAYLDRIGDTHKTRPLSFTERHLGYLVITPQRAASSGASAYHQGTDILISGARWPEGATFTPSNTSYDPVRLEPNPLGDATWMLDWSFSANKQATPTDGNRDQLRTYRDNGELVGNGAPTWFYIADYAYLPVFHEQSIRDHTNAEVALLHTLQNGSENRRPMIMGTVGPLGSGADLELASGGDELSETVSPVSLRILLQDAAPVA